MRSIVDQLCHIAVHEGGHAVVGLSLGMAMLRVEIGDMGAMHGGRAMGGVTWDAPDDDLKKLDRPDDVAVMAIAGASAERRIMGDSIPGGFTRDLEILRICLGWFDPLTEARRPALNAYVAQADSAVADNEAAIRRAAAALIAQTRLRADEVIALL